MREVMDSAAVSALREGTRGTVTTADDAVVIDLAAMRGVRVDPMTPTARVSGGATWGDLNAAAYPFGLATTGGIISTTGVGG